MLRSDDEQFVIDMRTIKESVHNRNGQDKSTEPRRGSYQLPRICDNVQWQTKITPNKAAAVAEMSLPYLQGGQVVTPAQR